MDLCLYWDRQHVLRPCHHHHEHQGKNRKRAGNVRRGVSWRCVKSVTVSVVRVSAQLMMEDVNVRRACL